MSQTPMSNTAPTPTQAPVTDPAASSGAATPAQDSGSLLGGSGVSDAPLMGTPPTGDPTGTPVSEQDKGYEAQQPVQGLAPLPENASDDQKREFQNKLRALNGAPEAPEKYGNFGFGDDVKIDTSSEDYKYYTSLFHELGLNQQQAKKLLEKHKEYADKQVEHIKRKNELSVSEYRNKVKNDFVKAQGGEAAYEVFRATAEQGFKATAKGANLTQDDIRGLLNIMGDDPRFVKIFNHIGRNFKEDVLVTGATPSAPEPTMENIFEGMFKTKGD